MSINSTQSPQSQYWRFLVTRFPYEPFHPGGGYSVSTPREDTTKIIPRGLPRAIPNNPWKRGGLSIQPKIPEISVGSSNGTDHFGLVRPEYSGPPLKVVHSDRSGHFGQSDRNVPFHLPKLLSPVPLFCILLTRTSSFQWKVKYCE